MDQPLRIVIFGLSITSSWGNGHATTYRGLVRGLAERGHDVLFLERDVPWYAANRDMPLVGVRRAQGIINDLDQSSGNLLRVNDDIRHVAERHLNSPIGRFRLHLGVMKRSIDEIGKVRFDAGWRDGFGEIHQLGNDVREAMRLLTYEAAWMIDQGKISGRIAKTVFEAMLDSNESPQQIVSEKGLEQVSDAGSIETAIEQVIGANAKQVAQYRSGNEKVFGFFVGQIMKATHGKANPQKVNEILREKLKLSG